MKNNNTPRVWVGCLAAYNAGTLYGEWVDADDDAETIDAEIARILKNSPVRGAEEAAIFDTEHMGKQQPSCNGEDIARVGAFISKHSTLGLAVLDYYDDFEEAEAALTERFHGEYESVTDYAEELMRDTMEIPAALESYIDFSKFARDLGLGGDIVTLDLPDGRVAVFSAL